MKSAVRGMELPSVSWTASRRSFDDRQPRDLAVDDLDAARVEHLPFGRRDRVGVREEDDVVRPLAEEVRVVDRAGAGVDDTDRLVANLPAVAVGAVEEVSAPALAGAGDVGQPVDRSGREEEPSRGQGPAPGEAEREAAR